MTSARRPIRFGMALLAAACAWPFTAPADEGPDGRALFQGYAAFAAGPHATRLRLPVAYAACANCHGDRGSGGRESALLAPAIDWRTLQTSTDAEGAYASDEAVIAAVTDGVGRAGRVLSAAMPRYVLQADEARALVSYLKRIGTRDDQPPGATQRTLHLGTILPLSGTGSDLGREVLAGLHDIFDTANATGGIHGRTLTLKVGDSSGGRLREALTEIMAEPVYALAGSLWPGSETEAEALLAARRIPNVGTLIVREKADEANEWVLDLLPPLETQQQTLERALRSCHGERWGLAVSTPGTTDPAADIRWVTPDRLGPLALAKTDSTLCLGLGMRAAVDLSALTAPQWRTLIVLPFPTEILSLREGTEARTSHWRQLGRASARLVVELLAEAGPQLTERSMLQAAQTLRGFRPIRDASPVRFSQSRRFGWDPTIIARSPDRIASP